MTSSLMPDVNGSILVVEDEAALTAVLVPVLSASGYQIATADCGVSARRQLFNQAFDLVLLDLGLPDEDGKELIEPAVAAGAAVIVISARHQEAEKVASLDRGADDYVDKPFEIGVLMARIRAAIRRRGAPTMRHSSYRNGPLHVDIAARRVTLEDQVVRLSPKEWGLLSALVASAGQVVTHKRLLAAGWGTASTDAQYLRVYMGLLRQKIEEDPSAPRILLTEPGVGYRLAAPSNA
jgi:two-component system KDP operon response regulator KdpE